MKLKDKKLNLLRVLYNHKFDGHYYDVLEILQQFGPTNRDEAFNIAKTLHNDGLIRWIGTKDGASAEISPDGVEFLEEQNLEEKYDPPDMFDIREKETIIRKLDELSGRLSRIEVGQRITYDDLLEELEILKKLLHVLGKKDWRQMLKGKLMEAGFGQLADQVSDLIIATFKDGKLLDA